MNDTRKYLEYDDENDQVDDYRKPVKVKRPGKLTDRSAGFGVTQNVFKKSDSKVRGGG